MIAWSLEVRVDKSAKGMTMATRRADKVMRKAVVKVRLDLDTDFEA